MCMPAGKPSIGKSLKIYLQTHQVIYNIYDNSNHDLQNFSGDGFIFQR